VGVRRLPVAAYCLRVPVGSETKSSHPSSERIGGFNCPPVAPVMASSSLGYRNKATYPLGISATGHVQAGYYQKAATS